MDLSLDASIESLAATNNPLLYELGLRFRRSKRDWLRLAGFGCYDCIPFALDWEGRPIVLRTWGVKTIADAPVCLFDPLSGATEILCESLATFIPAYVLRRFYFAFGNELPRVIARSDDEWAELEGLDVRFGGSGHLGGLREALAARQAARLGKGGKARRERVEVEHFRARQSLFAGTHQAFFAEQVAAMSDASEDTLDVPSLAAGGPFAHVIELMLASRLRWDDPARSLVAAAAAIRAPWHHDASWSFPSLVGSPATEPGVSQRALRWTATQLLVAAEESPEAESDAPIVAARAAHAAGPGEYDGVAHAELARVLAAEGDHSGACAAMLTYLFFASARELSIPDSTLPLLAASAERCGMQGLVKSVRAFGRGLRAEPVGVREGGAEAYANVVAARAIGDEATEVVTWTDEALAALETRSGRRRFPEAYRAVLLETGHLRSPLPCLGSHLDMNPSDEAVGLVGGSHQSLAYLAGPSVVLNLETGVISVRDGARLTWVAEDLNDYLERLAFWSAET